MRLLAYSCRGKFQWAKVSILVVDDEMMILLDLESAMVEAGFEVVAARNALDAIKAFDADPLKFKALMTDIRLGAGKSGWDIAGHIRRARPAMPVVYVSGDSAIHCASEGLPNSIMIAKPFFLPQTVTAVSLLLNQHQTGLASDGAI
jgi:DNA-binding NtrC family response regulator